MPRVLPSPEGVLLLREAHAAPPRSNRRSASQQLDVVGCLRSVLLCARMRAAAVGTPMCWSPD